MSSTFSTANWVDVDEDEDEDDEEEGFEELVSEFDEECVIDAKAGLSVLIAGTLPSMLVLHPDNVPRTRAAAITLLHNLLFIKQSPFGTQNQEKTRSNLTAGTRCLYYIIFFADCQGRIKKFQYFQIGKRGHSEHGASLRISPVLDKRIK